MLVLSRQRDETIMIGDEIEITIVDIRGDKVRLGINAPTRIAVHRKEVYEAIRRENTEASRISGRDLAPIAAAISPGPAKSQTRSSRTRAGELAARPTPAAPIPASRPATRPESNGAPAPPPAIARSDPAKAAGR